MPEVSPSDLIILGLLAEQPRHGYELESVIQERGIREWTPLGFSSIYYVLHRLEGRGLVSLTEQANEVDKPKARRIFEITEEGLKVCLEGTRMLLEKPAPLHSPVLVGVANSALMSAADVVDALRLREDQLREHVEALRQMSKHGKESLAATLIFNHSITMLRAELRWISNAITKLEGGG